MQRAAKLKALESHAWFGRVYKKLSQADLRLCVEFIAANEGLDAGAFEKAVHRMFLDKLDKPRRWVEITELLHCCR